MALFASSARGTDHFSWRDWAVAYLSAWLAPVPLGVALLVVPLLVLWAFEALGVAAPFEDAISLAFGIGWVVMFAPMLTWVGLVIAAPVVWLVLRLGWGGWVSFVLGGVGAGYIAAALVGGMAPLIPTASGAVIAVILRAILGWLRPAVFGSDEKI